MSVHHSRFPGPHNLMIVNWRTILLLLRRVYAVAGRDGVRLQPAFPQASSHGCSLDTISTGTTQAALEYSNELARVWFADLVVWLPSNSRMIRCYSTALCVASDKSCQFLS
jgi:hypothetical protein